MKAVWQHEKQLIGELRKLKEEIDDGQDRSRAGAAPRRSQSRRASCGSASCPSSRRAPPRRPPSSRSCRSTASFLREEVTEEDVAAVVAKWTGIPVDKMLEGEQASCSHMEERLHERVIGQDEAVEAIANAVRRARAGLPGSQPPDRLVPLPRARPAWARPSSRARSPTSCSTTRRTWSASTCREYMEKHAVSRLIGAPPGYVGYDEGGQLTEAVRRRPYSVVLFDEIEKAHPDVFNTLLQVLDDGRLTDGQGRTVDFRNTVIIMTSNVGSQYPARTWTDLGARDKVMAELRRAVQARVPEPHRRHRRLPPAGADELDSIVDLQFARLRKLLRDRELDARADAGGAHLLGDRGYDPPVRRAAAQARASCATCRIRWPKRCIDRRLRSRATPSSIGAPDGRRSRRADDGRGSRRATRRRRVMMTEAWR